MAAKFVHLHLHTEYSLLDGLSKINPLMDHIKENKMDTVALSDHGVMYGAVEFYQKAQKAGVKPIIGVESYITNIDHKKRGDRKKGKNFHLLLLAKSLEGYKNLMTLSSIAHLEGYYYRPRFDHKTLKKYSKGLICTSACVAGEVAQALIEDDYEKAKKVVDWHADIFGEDYYLEIQRHQYDVHVKNVTDEGIRAELMRQSEIEKKVNEGVVKLSREFGIPIIATNDAHYIKQEDATAQDALVCVATGKNVSDTKRLRYIDTPSFYVTSPKEMEDLFPDHPDALSNTLKVADKCDIELQLYKYFFPAITLPKGKTAEEVLKSEVDKGLKEKFGEITKELRERADYELDVIIKKDYAAYFLIYQDMSNWAHENLIPINTRGSAAGSLVSYSLGITTVDPMRYSLPFERFLNPFRPSAPDIDMDIADDKREEMIAHLTKKYGQEKVAQICTFGRMLARGSVRDIARVLGYPYETGDRISKMIPPGAQGFPMTIDRALDESDELKALYDSDTDARRIVDLSKQVEGNARHISVHAAGVVISPTKLTDFVPLQHEPTGEKVITQYEMHACEDVGLVKLDILGIRNLSILREAVQRVKAEKGETVNLLKIPLDDKKTFEMLARGETMGVFQLSGGGMTKHLVELKPERIEDIMQMVALYRPGPMAFIPEYIKRKHNPKLIKYMDPRMENFLKDSYGILVYQDDVLYCALELSGYDWGEVDIFRKAIGKKIPGEMQKQKEKFISGCIERGMEKKKAQELFSQIETFAAYGFNKAHAASYGMVAYQTAYMKANYPVEYMASLLTAEANDSEKISQAVQECRRMGVKVLEPSVNESGVGFRNVEDKDSLEGKAIRFGLSAIKNVGDKAIDSILEAREDGKFLSFADFCSRIDSRKVNKRVLESLIKVGALSMFGNRATLLSIMDEVRAKTKPKENNGQQDLFSAPEENKEVSANAEVQQVQSQLPELPDKELENLERQLLGLSLNAKPLEDTLSPLLAYSTHKIGDLLERTQKTETAQVACVVSSVRVVTTKKSGAEMAFAKVDDGSGTMDAVIFPKIYSESKAIWVENSPVLLSGKLDERDDTPAILVNTVETPETVKENVGVYKISVPKGTGSDRLMRVKTILKKNPGTNKVVLNFEGNGAFELKLPFGVAWNEELSRKISTILAASGYSNVK